jgi:hypothetical protein
MNQRLVPIVMCFRRARIAALVEDGSVAWKSAPSAEVQTVVG